MSKKLILFVLIGIIAIVNAKKTCKEKIQKSYPNAKCLDVDDLNKCSSECKRIKHDQCQGRRGQIQKLNCKEDNGHGKFTCCCK